MLNANNFDLNLLRVFDALIRERSVSAAAERLCLSQPAVSNALSRLRKLLNDPLFVRTRKGMEPTPFALRMQEPVQDGLLRIRAGISQVLTFEPRESDRTFRLNMNDVGSASFLPLIMSRLMSEAPGIDIEVCEIGISAYEDMLDSGAADLAIGRVVLSDTFRSQFLMRTQYVAILRDGHPGLTEENGMRAEDFAERVDCPVEKQQWLFGSVDDAGGELVVTHLECFSSYLIPSSRPARRTAEA